MATARYSDFALYRRLLSLARPYWLHIIGVFVLSLLSVPLTLLNPLPLKIAVDSVIGSRPLPSFLEVLLPLAATRSGAGGLLLAVALLVATALLSRLLDLASSLLRTYTTEKLVLGFRAQLFRHVQRLSLSYHDSKGTSDSTYRIQHDAPSIASIALDGVIPFITAGCTLVSMLYITARLDGQLVLIALAVSPAFYFITRARRRTLRGYSREVKKLESSALSVVQEVLGAVRVVKAFGQEDREHSRFVRRSYEGLRKRIRLAGIEGGYGLLVGLTTAAGTGAVLYVGVRHVQAGTLSVGNLLLVMAYLTRLYEPLRNIGRRAASLQTHLAGAERAFSLLDEAPDVPEHPDARPLSRASGGVAFHNVSFAYEEDRLVLHELSFQIPPGSRVGFAGKTGVGKTTLVNLLTRFYDPTSGRILLDGVDLRDYKLADLRNQFAMVLQESVLFSTSIAENIAYARPEAEFAEIVAAAKEANAHEFIIGLPNGYDTLVGERGMRLSGGERQRISLARAFLKDAPILILDEPTSSVDVDTEAVIIEAMGRLMRRRTTFLIAHRLSSLKDCDLLLVLEDGRVGRRTNVSATVRKALADGGLEAIFRGGKAGA